MVNKNELLKLYPKFVSVYGPYVRKDRRKYLVLCSKSSKTSLSYPKAIMELHLGRRLSENETVDHIDRDFNNNSLDNLQVLDRSVHIALDVRRRENIETNCILCGKRFSPTRNQISNANRKQGKKAGPFCSKKCSGLYGK